MKGVILAVFDGLGIAPAGPGNAYTLAQPVNFERAKNMFPHTQLRASGESVGLPAHEVGSTEVGHINLGAGNIVYQSLPRINLSIADGTFFSNPAFLKAIDHVQRNNSTLHLLGLLGNGTVHASSSHLYALLFLCKEKGISNVTLHMITDGRDSPPKAAHVYIDDIESRIQQLQIGRIGSIMGRYYAMDRDRRWERIEKAYTMLTQGTGPRVQNAKEAVDAIYAQGKTDEFVEPSIVSPIGMEPSLIKPHDAVIFYNFRIDRPRELTKAFVLENFEQDANKAGFDPYAVKYGKKHIEDPIDPSLTPPFKRGSRIEDLCFVTMTEYEKDLPVDVAFSPNMIKMPIGRILSENGIRQLRMAESEKEKFVTNYFNGLRSEAFPMEDRIIIPSPKVPTYDLKPEMSARELTDTLIQKIHEGNYRFILINYANADMVGHTGNLQAAIQAVKVIDECYGRIMEAALANDYMFIATADHGNVEEMINPQTGGASTEHTGNPVPCIFVEKSLQNNNRVLQAGILADVGPTLLKLLGIPQPRDMTGRDLLQELAIAR